MRLWQLIGIAACIASILPAYGEEIDCTFVDDASYAVKHWPPQGGLPIDSDEYFSSLMTIHQLVPGTGTAILLRAFDEGDTNTVDDERYWKMTVVLPEVKEGKPITAPLTANSVRLSRGGSAWVHNGSGYIGTLVSGEISANRLLLGRLIVHLDADIDTQLVADPQRHSMFHIEGDYDLDMTSLSKLTPWLGSVASLDEIGLAFRDRGKPAVCKSGNGKILVR